MGSDFVGLTGYSTECTDHGPTQGGIKSVPLTDTEETRSTRCRMGFGYEFMVELTVPIDSIV